jgi:hypothetical protein
MSVLRRSLFGLIVMGAVAASGRSASAAPLTVDYVDSVTGWEWADLTQTTGLTWNQVNTACSQDGVTACASDIGAIELSGWIWATRNQVRDLFVNATDLTAAQMADYFESDPSGASTWAPQFHAAFSPTTVGNVMGWSATLLDPTSAYSPNLQDGSGGFADFASASSLNPVGRSTNFIGVWLHREAATVPEPAALLMLGSGVAGLCAASMRRRRRDQDQ